MTSPAEVGLRRRALVVGTGLIGGSIALGLRRRGWHVSGLDADEEQLRAALQAGVVDAAGDDPLAEVVFVAVPAAAVAGVARGVLERRRPAGRRGGDRRERGQDDDRRRGRPPTLHRRPPDGRIRADRAARRRPRPVRGSGLGPDPDRDDRSGGLQPAEGRRDEPGRRRARPLGSGPRPTGRGGVPRAAPGRGHADERRRRWRRAGRHAAPSGRRRLSRHDPGRRRPPRDLARHLRRERRRHRRCARCAGDGPRRNARPRGRTGPDGASRLAAEGQRGPEEPAGPRRAARTPGRAAHPGSGPGGRPGRDHIVGRRCRHRHLRHRDRALGRGPARCPHPGRRQRRCRHPRRGRGVARLPRRAEQLS